MQRSGPPNGLELTADPRDPLADQPTVGLDLGLARTTHKAEATALTFEVGPASHQPAALIDVALPASDGESLAWVYRHGQVVAREDADAIVRLKVRLNAEDAARLTRRLGLEA
jgi:hypothetical protein